MVVLTIRVSIIQLVKKFNETGQQCLKRVDNVEKCVGSVWKYVDNVGKCVDNVVKCIKMNLLE